MARISGAVAHRVVRTFIPGGGDRVNEKERAFVTEAGGDGEMLDGIERLVPSRTPWLFYFRDDGASFYPLSAGDRAYLRNVEEEDLLIVHLMDDEEEVLRILSS